MNIYTVQFIISVHLTRSNPLINITIVIIIFTVIDSMPSSLLPPTKSSSSS